MSFLQNFDQHRWERDIDSFTRWKTFLSKIKTPDVRKRIIDSLHKTQERWPKYISKNEIPLE